MHAYIYIYIYIYIYVCGQNYQLYILTREEYKPLQNAATYKYKKIAKKMKDKIFHINGDSNYFMKMKDHKEHFRNKPTVRLINPGNNQIGRTSKVILGKINIAIKSKLRLNQWKNTNKVIDWFASIDEICPIQRKRILSFDQGTSVGKSF